MNGRFDKSLRALYLEQRVLFRARPRVLPNGRVQLVVPPFATLLARSTVEVPANQAPVLRAVLQHLTGQANTAH